MRRLPRSLGVVVAAVLLTPIVAGPVLLAGAQAQPAQKQGKVGAVPAGEGAAAPGTAEGAKVEGFRAATFGMTESQVRAAIRKDFKLGDDKVAVEENPIERTTALLITVPDLLPEAGPARISYMLGFKSKKLIQINVVWGAGQTPAVKPEKLQLAAATLQQYFLGQGFPPDRVMANARVNDGSVLVFQGVDAQNRMTRLRLIGMPGEGADQEKGAPPMTLLLSYIQDPQNPDVYRIAKGQF
jgi:hypothetical protein